MSGVISIGTLAATALSTGMSIYSGSKQLAQQKKSLQQQEIAQQEAKQASISQTRKSEIAANAANLKTPDIASIITRAAQAGAGGIGSTMLTGPGGVKTTDLNLGKSTLLGS